ncbi:RidA family protein [Actinosynnema pretiosum subsp. pretiosum]|uniref:Endoribonuclease L-PSP n=2 Tax=Actinosynnema TaxID=40566 RepID=C6WIN3_ACTMD|nr:RidA family protein [Actinosynnema mirum]ACU38123.1 Endoribonuclease L-PSP [Actinosynnema mirum DSM 43827]AXX31625.1 Endoribonuclease L-PSP [Actinosynnema pretiosum subsp. pretiosum]QUF04355.1 RidA family protein [Actinosynnema pretiosum subsp. pretiosum]
MAITLINPEGLPEVPPYRQLSVATGSKLLFLAGQVSWDATGATVGDGDLAEQVAQCYRNVAKGLAGAGATLADLAKLTVYVVDWTPDKMPQFLEGVARAAADLGGVPVPPASLIGVAALDVPEHLVEVEAVAVLD